jgi:uncharacterized membrane protein YdjX (TVP38/TMEM64 family)
LLPLMLLAIAGASIVAFGHSPREVLAGLSVHGDRLRGLVSDWGALAVVAYIAGYAALMTTLWVPAWICSIVGGFLFGLWFGALYALLGASLGAVAVFVLVRGGLGDISRHAGPAVRRFEAGFVANGFWYLVLARLVPVFPFALVNSAAALVAVPLHTYAAATVVGIVPSTLVYAGIGNGLRDGLDAGAWSRPSLLWPLAGLAALALVAMIYGQVRGARSNRPR